MEGNKLTLAQKRNSKQYKYNYMLLNRYNVLVSMLKDIEDANSLHSIRYDNIAKTSVDYSNIEHNIINNISKSMALEEDISKWYWITIYLIHNKTNTQHESLLYFIFIEGQTIKQTIKDASLLWKCSESSIERCITDAIYNLDLTEETAETIIENANALKITMHERMKAN